MSHSQIYLRPRSVVVAALTFKRPGLLDGLLPMLAGEIALAEKHHPEISMRIMVIDNDPEASAYGVVESHSRVAGVPISYAHEATPGITAARNLALSLAGPDDLLVFIDDDEQPTTGWLGHLLRTFEEHPCAAVVGPVVSTYERSPDPWVAAGRFFQRRRMPTGTRTDVAGTGNLLLDMRRVRRLRLSFDPQFGLSGGEDTMFTRQLAGSGEAIVWCDEAIVMDLVPSARLTRRWVVTRVFRYGTSWSTVALRLAPTSARRLALRLRLTADGLARAGAGSARWLWGIAAGNLTHQARGVRTAARGLGLILGAWGFSHQEYRRAAKAAEIAA